MEALIAVEMYGVTEGCASLGIRSYHSAPMYDL